MLKKRQMFKVPSNTTIMQIKVRTLKKKKSKNISCTPESCLVPFAVSTQLPRGNHCSDFYH